MEKDHRNSAESWSYQEKAQTPDSATTTPHDAEAQSERSDASLVAESEDVETHYVYGSKRLLLVLGLVLNVLVVAMDYTILATAIPRITTDFRSVRDVGWYGSVYLLTQTTMQPTFGKLLVMFDVKWVYLSAMLIFEIGSVVSAVAPNSISLIIGRAISGIGSSVIFSGGATIIGFSVELEKRPIYIGILSSVFGLSSVIGPLLGGLFTDRLNWRWCFWINLPIGAVAMAAVFFFFTSPKRKTDKATLKERLREFDYLGAVLSIGALVCLFLALQWGGIEYSWNDSRVYGVLLGFGLLTICFVLWEVKLGDKASVPMRLFKNRTVWSSSLLSGFLIMALYCHVYYLPFYFQSAKGDTAEQSGVRSIPYFLALFVASCGGGFVISAVGSYVEFAWLGTVLLAVGAGLLHTLRVESGSGEWIGYQVVAGLGVGFALQTPFIAIQTVLSSIDMPIGMAIAIFFNSLGGALTISVSQNIFLQGLRKNIPTYAPGVDTEAIIEAGASDVTGGVAADQVDGLQFAYNKSITDAFILAIAAGCCAFLASIVVVQRKKTNKSA